MPITTPEIITVCICLLIAVIGILSIMLALRLILPKGARVDSNNNRVASGDSDHGLYTDSANSPDQTL